MNASVSLPDPGEFHRGSRNGHAADLAIDDLHPYDLADLGEVVAATGLEPDPKLVEAQTRILEDELRAELDRLDHLDRGGLAQDKDEADPRLLPGFEALTGGDLIRARLGLGNQGPHDERSQGCSVPDDRECCPGWCADADLPLHGDGFDTTPESEVPHRGVPHDIPVKHGGKSLDHAGRAEVSAQLEQDRELAIGPVITLSVVVCGIEQYAWLTTAEATTLHRTLGQFLDDANDHG